MKKNLFLAALAFVAMASCTSDEFVGDTSPTTGNTTDAIQFVSSTPRVTRSDGATAAEELGYSFAVYATKTVGSVTSNVFAHSTYSTTSNTPYWVWYNTSTASTTTSNTHDWEYVGAVGNKTTPGGAFTLSTAQDIKFWDYSADQYDFIAYKANPVSNEIVAGNVSDVTSSGFTFSGSAAQLANLYVADKLIITEKSNPAAHTTADNKIGDAVKFTFRSGGSKVRLGIYETIPGYVVQKVKFRPNNAESPEFTETIDNAILSGSFNGTSSSATGTYKVTYNSTTGVAEFDNTGSASKYFDFGSFASATPTALGETSINPMWATGSAVYQSVLPNTDNFANMILYVDYDLYNAVSGETIHVYGAKAVVPAMYMKWNPNYAYTYLFKISDNTNGTTGTEGTSPEGLFPITFDAVTVAATDGQEVGIITTVSTPAITTYQEGSVSAAGITYANANGPIYITVNTNGTLADLTTSNTKLYTVEAGTTEADLILTTKNKTSSVLLSILAADEEKQGVTFASGKAAKFTPAASTTYAVEYQVSAAEAAVYTAVPDGTTLTIGNTYYTSDSGAGEFVSDGSEVADGTNYYTLTTPASPAVYQYKIIVVGANS